MIDIDKGYFLVSWPTLNALGGKKNDCLLNQITFPFLKLQISFHSDLI